MGGTVSKITLQFFQFALSVPKVLQLISAQNSIKFIVATFTATCELLQSTHLNLRNNTWYLHRLHSDVIHVFRPTLLVRDANEGVIGALRTLCTHTFFHMFSTCFAHYTSQSLHTWWLDFTTLVGLIWGSLRTINKIFIIFDFNF